MLHSHYIQTLLGIKDAIITKVEDLNGSIHIYFQLKREIHECPNCEDTTDAIHDYREQIIKGPPFGERFILYHYRKRRYVCPTCKKRFYENNSFVPRYHRISSRLVSFVLRELQSTSSRISVANRCNVSTYTI